MFTPRVVFTLMAALVGWAGMAQYLWGRLVAPVLRSIFK